MYCKKCGNCIDEDSLFCSHCGTKLTNNNLQNTENDKKEDKIYFQCKAHGIIGFRKDIVITDEYIQYNGTIINIRDIIGIGFVAIKNPTTEFQMGYIGGPTFLKIPGGMKTMCVAVNTPDRSLPFLLEFSNKDDYFTFVKIIWKLCINQVLVYNCKKLKRGEKIPLCSYTIYDDGLEFKVNGSYCRYGWDAVVKMISSGDLKFSWNMDGTCNLSCRYSSDDVDFGIGYMISPNVFQTLCDVIARQGVKKASDLIG